MPLPSIPFQQLSSQDYQSYQQAYADTQLQSPVGNTINMALAQVKDYLADRIRASIKAKLPGSGFAAFDSLSLIGQERGIQENPDESDTSFASRLNGAFTSWQLAGTALGILKAIYDAGIGPMTPQARASNPNRVSDYSEVSIIQQNGGYYTMSVNAAGISILSIQSTPRTLFGGNTCPSPVLWQPSTVYAPMSIVVPNPINGFWYQTSGGGTSGTLKPPATLSAPLGWPTTVGAIATDTGGVIWQCKGTEFWSRFAVVFNVNSTNGFPSSWGTSSPYTDGTLGFGGAGVRTPTTTEATRIYNLVQKWKSAHSTLQGIYYLQSNAGAFGSNPLTLQKLWDSSKTVGSGGTTFNPTFDNLNSNSYTWDQKDTLFMTDSAGVSHAYTSGSYPTTI